MKFLALVLLAFPALASPSDLAFTKLKETTVHIAIGTGFIFESESKTSYLITNYHVCIRGSWQGSMVGSFPEGETIKGKVVKQNPLSDLCAVKIERRHAVLKLAKTLAKNQSIYTRGYPYGVLSTSKGRYIGIGRWDNIYALEDVGECFKGSARVLDGRGVVQGCQVTYIDNMTDMYSRPGSSGSPVVDENGDLVGVMSSWDGGSDQGGMVTLENIQDFVKGL